MAYSKGDLMCIAKLIQAQSNGNDFVYCFDENQNNATVYWSCATYNAPTPHSKTIDVLQAAHEGSSAAIGKLQFYYSHSRNISPMCNGMLSFLGVNPQPTLTPHNVADQDALQYWGHKYTLQQSAARVSGLNAFNAFQVGPAPAVNLRLEGRGDNNTPGHHTLHRLYMMASFALTSARVTAAAQGAPKEGHNIGAVLASPDGTILSWGRNTKTANYTFHAELNAIQSYYRRTGQAIPANARLYTTLKPCKMCAGMIRACMPGSPKVYYGQNDPGAHAQNTALDGVPGALAQIGAQGIKAVKTYTSMSYDNSVVQWPNLSNKLQALRGTAIQSGTFALTQFLSQNSATQAMHGAREALVRKGDKYSTAYYGNENVRRALIHMRPFLISCGLAEWNDNALTIPADA